MVVPRTVSHIALRGEFDQELRPLNAIIHAAAAVGRTMPGEPGFVQVGSDLRMVRFGFGFRQDADPQVDQLHEHFLLR